MDENALPPRPVAPEDLPRSWNPVLEQSGSWTLTPPPREDAGPLAGILVAVALGLLFAITAGGGAYWFAQSQPHAALRRTFNPLYPTLALGLSILAVASALAYTRECWRVTAGRLEVEQRLFFWRHVRRFTGAELELSCITSPAEGGEIEDWTLAVCVRGRSRLLRQERVVLSTAAMFGRVEQIRIVAGFLAQETGWPLRER